MIQRVQPSFLNSGIGLDMWRNEEERGEMRRNEKKSYTWGIFDDEAKVKGFPEIHYMLCLVFISSPYHGKNKNFPKDCMKGLLKPVCLNPLS